MNGDCPAASPRGLLFFRQSAQFLLILTLAYWPSIQSLPTRFISPIDDLMIGLNRPEIPQRVFVESVPSACCGCVYFLTSCSRWLHEMAPGRID